MAGRKPKFDQAMSDAERQALRVALSSDISSGMPKPADLTRRELYKNDLLGFGYYYFAKWCRRAPSKRITDYCTDLMEICHDGGMQAEAMARGYGKTTWAKIAVIWAVVYGHVDFVVYLADGQPNAEAGLSEVRAEFECNARLAADFPEACYPFRALRGKAQRCASQNFMGEPTKIMLAPDELHMANVPGSLCAGSVIVARGLMTGFQGLNRDGKRPKLIIGDDLQSKKDAKSQTDTETRLDILRGGVLGLGGHDDKLGVLLLGTVNQTDDFFDQILNKEANPEWFGSRHGLMRAWPVRQDLWDIYKARALSDIRMKKKTLPSATAWYVENKTEMDRGAEPEDTELFNSKHEVSAIQHAWNIRIKLKDKAYFAEYENKPIRLEGTLYEISPALVASRVNHCARWTAPNGAFMCVASCDVNHDKLRWSVVAVSKNHTVCLVDRGVFPESSRPLIPERSSELRKKSLLWMGLLAVLKTISALHVVDQSGRYIPIRVLGFDSGYMADTVYNFCAQAQAPFAVTAMKGFGFKTYSSTGKHVCGEPGFYCHMARTEKGSFLSYHTDFWKEFCQRAWLAEPLSPGSMSLWGDNPEEHLDFAQSQCAEKLAGKSMMQTRKGMVEVWMWHIRPDENNHFLDNLVTCYALASWFRAFILTQEAMEAVTSADPDAPEKVEASQVVLYPRVQAAKRQKKRIVRVPMGSR